MAANARICLGCGLPIRDRMRDRTIDDTIRIGIEQFGQRAQAGVARSGDHEPEHDQYHSRALIDSMVKSGLTIVRRPPIGCSLRGHARSHRFEGVFACVR